MRREEALAKRTIEFVIRDLTLDFEADQSSSRADFRMRWKDGRTGCLEVTTAVDRPVRKTNRAIEQRTKANGWFVRDDRLRCRWLIEVGPGTRIRRLGESISTTLHELEERGLERFPVYGGSSNFHIREKFEELRKKFEDLGVRHARRIGWKGPGEVWINSIGGGGWVGIGHVNDAVEEEAGKPDNLAKLSIEGVDERHLFVAIVDWEHEAWSSVLAATGPGRGLFAPKGIDPAIDRIWCVAERGDLTVLLSWTKGASSWSVHSIDPREVAIQDGV